MSRLLYCPLCDSPLTITQNEIHPEYEDFRCSFKQDRKYYDYRANSYNDTHYRKYVTGGFSSFDKIEEITIFPYQIINYHITYFERQLIDTGVVIGTVPEHNEVFCAIKKYNPDRMTSGPVKESNPGYDRIIQVPAHLHPDSEEKLRERVKVLLMLL